MDMMLISKILFWGWCVFLELLLLSAAPGELIGALDSSRSAGERENDRCALLIKTICIIGTLFAAALFPGWTELMGFLGLLAVAFLWCRRQIYNYCAFPGGLSRMTLGSFLWGPVTAIKGYAGNPKLIAASYVLQILGGLSGIAFLFWLCKKG